MRFLFDCEDEICLPAAYLLVDEVKPFIDKMKAVEVGEDEAEGGRKVIFKKIIENMMVKYPADTGKMFAKLWILDEGEPPIHSRLWRRCFQMRLQSIFLPLCCPP